MDKKIRNYKKNQKCILQIGGNKVILSDPIIIPFNSYRCNSFADVMYFYYDIKIKTRENKSKDGKTKLKWKTIASASAHDFGGIRELPSFIDRIIKADPDELSKKEYFLEMDEGDSKLSGTDYETQYEVSCTGMLEEDSYIIKKIHRHFDENYNAEKDAYAPEDNIWYEMYIGVSQDPACSTVGFRYSNLTEEDLLIIKKWAEDFLELALSLTQADIKRMEESDNTRWFRDYIKGKYPEDYPRWKDIWIRLNDKSYLLEEYQNYVNGNVIENPLFSKWEGDKIIPQELIKAGMKDWEAYIKAVEFVENTGAASNKTL